MAELIYVFVFVLGTVVGSFLNVVICRYNTGRPLGGRSQCLTCGQTLRWFELVPILSFLLQGGRCRHCQSRISWQYPLVELAAGLLFVLIWRLGLPPPLTFIYFTIFSLLLVVAVYDLRHKVIPDGLNFAFIGLAFLKLVFLGLESAPFLSGLALFSFFGLLWLASRGRAMGLGDAKLGAGIGLLLGPSGGISAVILAFWLGAAVGVGLILLSRISRLPSRRRRFTMKSEMPFAPFLIISLILYLFFQVDVFRFI